MTDYLYLDLNGEQYKIKNFNLQVERESEREYSRLRATRIPTGNVYVEITGEEV